MVPSFPAHLDPQHELMFALPEDQPSRLLLFAIRRMALGGIHDAHAANRLLSAFGRSYRRPLVLMRAMMLELARASDRTILVAPCCCPRMTEDEMRIVAAMHSAPHDPHDTHHSLTLLLDNQSVIGALTCLQAVAQSFADGGQPLGSNPFEEKLSLL